jgi:hypothetical protein
MRGLIDINLGTVRTGARGHINGTHMSMKGLATLLSRFEREIVLDQTGLSGPFEVRLASRKGPLDVLAIDHAEKVPTDN